MSNISESLKRKIWKRDRFRCQECGIKVGQAGGLRPHTHHKIPKSLGGSDEESNLTTLCQPCHVTKRDHTFMFDRIPVEDFPQFIKYLLRDIGINLLAYAEQLDPRNFPSPVQTANHINKAQEALQVVNALVEDCRDEGIGTGNLELVEDPAREEREFKDIVDGLRIVWMSHWHQRALDQIIFESREGQQNYERGPN